MTSEILILTPSTVALAADSAVTVGGRKTYNGVNKLFMLSNDPPMGIMTYSLANFSYMPLETIIKEFRNEITDDLKSVSDFKNSFEEFLKKLLNKSEHTYSFQKILSKFVKDILEELENVDDATFESIVNNVATKSNHEDLKEYSKDIINKLNQNEKELMKLIPKSMHNDKQTEFLGNLKEFFLVKAFLEPYTGIVIAGFDEDRLFPSYIEFNITYLYDNKFILKTIEKQDIDGDIVEKLDIKRNQVHVRPLAQGDVINTFLSNMDDITRFKLINYVNNIYNNYSVNLKDAISSNPALNDDEKQKFINEISKIDMANDLLTNSFEDFLDQLKLEHAEPILESIGSLPKEELSNLAESLIKITSLKRKVQSDLETVGGPVDVAIITKGDGFIWTKRKHYFDGGMNPQFFERKRKYIKYLEK